MVPPAGVDWCNIRFSAQEEDAYTHEANAHHPFPGTAPTQLHPQRHAFMGLNQCFTSGTIQTFREENNILCYYTIIYYNN